MSAFPEAYGKSMGYEGAYSNNPNDTGGETWKGCARNKHPDSRVWVIVDSLRSDPSFPKNLAKSRELEEAIQEFYLEEFWNRMGCDNMPPALGIEMFDAGVNCGTGTAVKFLQTALNVFNSRGTLYPDIAEDGGAGPGTRAALDGFLRTRKDLGLLLKAYGVLRGAYYIDCCRRREANEDFVAGWFNNRVHMNPI